MTIGTEVDNYVMQATGSITVPSAGYWTFCANADDGFSATINGTNFQANAALQHGVYGQFCRLRARIR